MRGSFHQLILNNYEDFRSVLIFPHKFSILLNTSRLLLYFYFTESIFVTKVVRGEKKKNSRFARSDTACGQCASV